jgi:phosphoenolpyruvate synthase/pyruvate phosphate dikinase
LTGLLIKEAARRNALPFKLLRFCTVEETVKLLEKGKAPSMEELKERRHYLSLVTTRNKRQLLTGKKARDYVKKNVVKERVSKGQQMNGQIASPGLIKGEVRVINQVKDLSEMVDGAVLVSVSTNPDLMPAIKKSAAIITEMGGMTCHAAIVSRELNKPCVIGVRNATKILKKGDIVEVDAYHGIVRRLKE